MPIARRSFLVGLTLAGFADLAAEAAPKTPRVGTVKAILGECTGMRPGGEKRRLAAGSPIFMNDVLLTGDNAVVDIELGTATRVLLRERSRLAINARLVAYGGQLDLPGNFPFEPLGDQAPAAKPLLIMAPRG